MRFWRQNLPVILAVTIGVGFLRQGWPTLAGNRMPKPNSGQRSAFLRVEMLGRNK